MSDEAATLENLKSRVREFSRERGWEQFHNPKDLGLALAMEVAEVLEHFRFKTNSEIAESLKD